MGLFSTLLHNTTAGVSSSVLASPDPTVIASGTKSSTTTTTNTTSSSTEISSSSNNTAIPTIIQLYTKHPIPFVAVDTSIVANDILAFHHFYNNDDSSSSSSSTAGSTTKSQWMKKFQNNTNLNTWLTTATATLSSFAPLQYFAVQCIPHSDYGSCHEKVPFHTTMVSSSNATADATTMATTAAAAAAATTVPTLRNSNTSKKQWYDMATKYLTPDLGIYECQVALSSSSLSLTDTILPTVLSSTANSTANTTSLVFCMVVDMSSPSQYNNVETTVTTIQQALIRFLIRHADSFRMSNPNASRHSGGTGSSTTVTSLYQLKNVTFGLANDDTTTAMTTSTTKDTATVDDTKIGIILQIGVIFEHLSSLDESKNATNPSSSFTATAAPLDYATQQQQHLLMYHLRKYAAALNATLLFINTDLSTSSSSFSNLETTVAAADIETTNTATTSVMQQQQPTVHVREIPWLWKALANHEPIWKYDSIEAMETGIWNPSRTATTESISSAVTNDDGHPHHNNCDDIYSNIYGPENHNVEWIESVLVRNANYPGHWDATKDSIWNVLPPTTTTTTTTTATTTSISSHEPPGDQLWLKELYDSIVPVMSSSNSTSATTATPTTASSSLLQTPPPTHKSGSGGPTQPSTQHSKTKTPNDAAVSSFFEDLLK